MKKIMTEEHSGMGGLYFLITNFVCAVIMTLSLQLSWQSQVISMADNLAYIACINTTIHNYIGNKDSYDAINPSIYVAARDGNYSPLADFNNMITSSGIATTSSPKCRVVWDKDEKRTRILFESFSTILGSKVTPHEQDATIEDF